MIRQWQYKSINFNCNVKLSYRDGLLLAAEIENPQEEFVIKPTAHFILREVDFLYSCRENKIDVVQIDREVSFDMFWEKYAYKASGRLPAQKAWDKLNKDEQIQAYDYIPSYLGHLKLTATAKKYGSSYLNSKIFIK